MPNRLTLKQAREKARYKIEQAADRACVPLDKLKQWERDCTGLDLISLHRLLRTYRTPIEMVKLL